MPEASRTSLHEVHELAAREGLGQGVAVVLQRYHRLFDEFAVGGNSGDFHNPGTGREALWPVPRNTGPHV